MTVDQATLLDALTRAGDDVRLATVERDRLIRDAVATGLTGREVARAVGLSDTAIQQILKRIH